ncbi:3-coathanger stack domain-containing protein, partial [Emticicia sp. W12TSBA100-4]|uniref:beta strand repeat-containing protein n=1 Tax=Emticicia sp. W12TSBA100-4 TaxID=3160965 RepID=UPI003305BEEB
TTSVTIDNSVPNAGITGTTNLTCTTTSVNRAATGGGTYSWSNGLGTNATVSITISGIYTVTVTNSNGCTATATTNVTLDNSVPNAGITGTENLSCTTTSVSRTATGGGTYSWSNGLGTSATVTITSSGIYTVTVTNSNGCTATATTNVTLDNSVPNAGITGTTNLSCTTTSVIRTATGGGTYSWSNGLGTSATVSITNSGIYTVTVTNSNGCTATATTSVTLDNSVPNAGITGTENLSCTTTSVIRTATGGGTYSWSNGSTSQSVNFTAQGTYSVTVTGINGCTSTATTVVSFTNDLEITVSNTGPYLLGQAIALNASGGSNYVWSGPNNFTSSSQNPIISSALSGNSGIYTVTVSSGVCTATATTNVIVSGIDPCTQIVDLQYVKATNPYQPLFSLTNGSTIQQVPDQVSILAVPICPSITIESMDMTIVGPELNWTILQNVQPNALFDNFGTDVFGRNFIPGTYTLTITGYAQDNRGGGVVYGPVVTTFTIVGNLATISAPTISNNTICAGSSVDVTFATTGVFDSNNNFQVELSDVNGRFINPTIIGVTSSVGTITCQIPQVVVGGNNYRIRVASSNQILASNPNMNAISIIGSTKNLETNLSGTVTEQASQRIIASNKVLAPASVTYQAGKAIELNPGFVVTSGSTFNAEIKGCNN